MDPLIGVELDGRYRLLTDVGEGAMGRVYRAERLDGSGLVAVKVLNEDCSEQPDLRERFEREARALFGLTHPHILDVQDFGVTPTGQPYLVMELLEGKSLDELVDSVELEPAAALQLGRQVLAGLAFAHAQGVLHRDLKTENVFVVRKPDGSMHAKLLDFGLVKFVDDERWGEGRKLTVAGSVMGSPAYMSPEQGTGGTMDARSDVYSAGVVLFELLTGHWPFEAESRVEMLKAHLLESVPKVGTAREGLSNRPELDALIEKSMAKEADNRWADAQHMLAALEAIPAPAAWLEGAPTASAATPAGSLPPPPSAASSFASPAPAAAPLPGAHAASQGRDMAAMAAAPAPQGAPQGAPQAAPAPLAAPAPEEPASRGPLIVLGVVLGLCVLATVGMVILFLLRS